VAAARAGALAGEVAEAQAAADEDAAAALAAAAAEVTEARRRHALAAELAEHRRALAQARARRDEAAAAAAGEAARAAAEALLEHRARTEARAELDREKAAVRAAAAAEAAAAAAARAAALDALRRTVADAVDARVPRDPARALQPTAAQELAAEAALKDELEREAALERLSLLGAGELAQPHTRATAGRAGGLTTETLRRDPRFRLAEALGGAGLTAGASQAAREALLRLGAAPGARRDAASTVAIGAPSEYMR
jgi:hypothetical protein